MRLATGASRRNLLIIGASVAFLASACSTSSGEKAASTTTGPVATTSSTVLATTSTSAAPATTEAAPDTTTTPPTTAAPAPGSPAPEQVAVGFLQAAVTGGDPGQFAPDAAVAKAATLEWADVADADRAGITVAMEPTFVSPEAQAGGPGECQLVGDITLQCAVIVSPPTSAAGEGSPTLYAVYVSNMDPASSLDDPKYGDYFVIDFEPLAG